MNRAMLRGIAAAVALVAGQAHAAMETVSFSGVVYAADSYNLTGPAVGETITGSYTFDTQFQSYGTDGSTYNQGSSINASGLSGSASFSGGAKITIGSNYVGSYSGAGVFKNSGAIGLNEAYSYVETYDQGNYGLQYLEVMGYGQDGNAGSTLFANPNAGLDPAQPMSGQDSGNKLMGYFQLSTPQGYSTGKFDVMQLTSSVSPVPEPGSLPLLLAGVGVIGVVARRRNPRA